MARRSSQSRRARDAARHEAERLEAAKRATQVDGDDAIGTEIERRPPPRTLFVGAIGLSAFLLFTLELLAGRLVLPVFGGAPGVWTTTLCFFTAVLFLGYLYAHIVATRLDARRGGVVHLVVAAIAIAAYVAAPTQIATLRLAGVPDAPNVLFAQVFIAGLPAFLLASTTPLLSAWYAGRGSDPWWLYAASNAASFAALIAYPLLIEPNIGLAAQRTLVGIGLGLLGLTLVTVVVSGWRAPVSEPVTVPPAPAAVQPRSAAGKSRSADAEPGLTVRRQLIWLFAAMVPAGLLSATTNFITTDLVSAPLLWVGPLAIYLLSFVVAFSAVGRRSLRVVMFLVPAAATLLWVPSIVPGSWPIVALLFVEFGAFGILAIAIHGRLALDRPEARHLTRFYLILSAGGALATAFVALVAPLIFDNIHEYPILIVAGLVVLAVLPGLDGRPPPLDPRAMLIGPEEDLGAGVRRLLGELMPYLLALAILGVLVLHGAPEILNGVLVFGAVGALAIAAGRSASAFAVTTVIAIVLASRLIPNASLLQERTFFGVVRVTEEGPTHVEYLGTTLHGLQYTDDRRTEPTSYFVPSGPIGDVFADLRARTDGASIAVVGLGTGTLAAYTEEKDTLAIFEIDQAIVDIADDPRYFTYLSESKAKPRIVLGDARLTLADEPDASFDVIFLDAFTSDSVPTHLLTREAIAGYMTKLRPGGILVFNVANRYYDLARPIGSTAETLGLGALALQYVPGDAQVERLGARGSAYAIVGRPEDVARFAARDWSRPDPGPVLTDDFFDILRSLRPDAFF